MFTPEERESLRTELIALAQADERVSGCALTGSASLGNEDRWSDIDLAFGVRNGGEVQKVAQDFTNYLYSNCDVAHHFDMPFGNWAFRVFFLANTLQVDLGLVPAEDFCALAPSFKLVFGECVERPHPAPSEAESLIGMVWLYALHVRSAIERGKLWQAEYMISGMRHGVLNLACLRNGLQTNHGRGFHLLPTEDTQPLEATLVKQLDGEELIRAFRAATYAAIREISLASPELGKRLEKPLLALTDRTPS